MKMLVTKFSATVVVAIAMLIVVGAMAHAQGVTSAAINGQVTDKAGKPLAGATIKAVHEPSSTVYGMMSRADGRFNIQNMRVGKPYTITVSFVGFQPVKFENVALALGQNLEFKVQLEESSVQINPVEVTGERNELMSTSRTGASQNVSLEQIESMPTITRSFQDFLRLSPQMVGTSAAGRNNRYNNIQIDGTQYNDLFGLGGSGTPGGQANANPISLDAIQEFQVVVAPYDVRQGRFSGSGVNAITRSGTNTLQGSAYFYFRNKDMVGDLNATNWLLKDANGNALPIGEFRDSTVKTAFANFNEYQAGFRVGGPIIENKLFFFANAEMTERRQPYDNIAFTQRNDGSLVQNIADTVGRILQSQYGYNPGSLGSYDTKRPSTKIFARLDWNLDETNRLTLRHNFVDASDDVFRPTTANVLFGNRNYVFNNNVNSTVLQWSSTYGANMSNELIVGYTRIRDSRDYVGSMFPTVNVSDSRITGVTISAGAENFSIANKLDQDVLEITDNFTWFLGDHAVTIGTQNEIFSFKNLFIRDYVGTYNFNSLNDLRNGIAARLQYSFARPGQDPMFAADFGAAQYGFYAQDEWSGVKNLKVTLGLRVDIPTIMDKPNYNSIADTIHYNTNTVAYRNNAAATYGVRTDKVFDSQIMFSPRLGVNYDLFGDKSTIIRGGAGIFTGRVPFVWISNQFGNTGVELARLDLRTASNDTIRFNPDLDPRDPAFYSRVGGATEINVTANDFKMPQVARFNLAVDHKLPYSMVFTLEGIYSQTLNDIYYRDINLGDRLDTTALGSHLPGGRGVYGTYSGRNTTPRTQVGSFSKGPFTNVILLENTSEGYQANISATLQRQVEEGVGGLIAYTYGVAKDQNGGLSSQAVSNWRYNHTPDNPNDVPLTRSLFDIPHRFIASLSYTFKYAKDYSTTLALFYEGRSGTPFSYVYDGDLNADGQVENDLIYIPKDKSDILLVSNATTRASATVYDQLEAYIGRDDYLKEHRGEIAERYGAREPWVNILDFRLLQAIPNPVFPEHKLEISVDILNVLNLLNSEWGRVQSVSNNRDMLLRFEGLAVAGNKLGENGTEVAKGTPMFSFKDKKNPFQYNDLSSRWSLQVGIRYTF